MKTVRCFLAINLELHAAKKIAERQQQLIAQSREFKTTCKWVPPQNMHVTVRYLGHITEPMIQAIKDSLEKVTQAAAPFIMDTGPIGVFDEAAPKILHYKMNDPSGDMMKFISAVHETIVNTGFKELDKPYVPHITLARLENAETDEIRSFISAEHDAQEESLVRDLVCYQSTISKTGVDYQLLWKLPLQKRVVTKENKQSKVEASDVSVEPVETADVPAESIGDEKPQTESHDNE